MLRETDSSLTRGFAARRSCFANFRAIARTTTSRRLFPPFGPDHDSSSLGVSVNRPLYFADDLFSTPLGNAQNPRRIVDGHWPAVVDSDRLPHMVIIRRATTVIREARRPERARLQSRDKPRQTGTSKKIGGSQLLNRSINFQRDVDTSTEQTS